MKTIKFYLLAIATFLLFFAGCFVNVTVDHSSVIPDESSMLKLVSVAALALYEVVVRVVPSIGDYSAVSWVIRWLKKISDTMNVRL